MIHLKQKLSPPVSKIHSNKMNKIHKKYAFRILKLPFLSKGIPRNFLYKNLSENVFPINFSFSKFHYP